MTLYGKKQSLQRRPHVGVRSWQNASAMPVAPEEHLLQKLISMGAFSFSSSFNPVGFCPRFCISASTQADHARAEHPKPLEQVIYPSVVPKKSLQPADRKPQMECGLHF